MSAEYASGYRKPPVETRFRKGQSGNPGGRPRPRPTRRQYFAMMIERGLEQGTPELATMECRSNLGVWAKTIVLDGSRGKISAMRFGFSLLDELDVMEGNLPPRRRRPARMGIEAAAFESEGEAEGSLHPVSERIIEEERSAMWCEYRGEEPRSSTEAQLPSVSRPATAGGPDETGSECDNEKRILPDHQAQSGGGRVARCRAGHDTVGESASPLSEGKKQGEKMEIESERNFLLEADRMARRKPSEKELRRREEQAEAEKWQKAYEAMRGKVKAFADRHGYEFPGPPSASAGEISALPHSEGQAQATIKSPAAEGPYTRALREKLVRTAAAERAEDERKAAIAAGVDRRTAALMTPGKEPEPAPPPDSDPAEPLPNYTIWMRGQRAAPP